MFCSLLLVMAGCTPAVSRPPLQCRGPFAPDATRQGIIAEFGAENVRDADVPVGEGETQRASVIFPGTPSAIEILWSGERPEQLRVAPGGTAVRSYQGIALGMDLAAIERINGRPFEMTGFDWDYAGTVTSWRGGTLDQVTGGACRLLLRFEPPPGTEDESLMGDRMFRSDDPRMRALNPRVYAIVLLYGR
jgi:hypothetical protein